MIKLQAIWKILTSEHFMVITSSGSITAHMPKSLKNLQIMKSIADQVSESEETSND